MELKPVDNKEKLLKMIYRRGCELEQRYYGCAQCVVAAVQDFFPLEPALVKAATSLSGGIASTTEGPCGALTGGILVLGAFFGRSREDFSDISRLRRPGPLVRVYRQKFRETYGGDSCREIQEHLFGRFYRFLDGEEYRAYEEAGGHVDKCPEVVGRACAWLAEILVENKISPKKTGPGGTMRP